MGKGTAIGVRRRWLSGGVVVELETVYCRRRSLARLLKDKPHLASYDRAYVPLIGFVVLTEDPVMSGKFTASPAYVAEARRDD